MLIRKGLATMLGALTLVAGMAFTGMASADTVTVGTLAPKRSPWGKVFTVWSKAVKKKTGGALELKFYFNGQQGDEKAMVAKMRAGQLDGAAVTAVGLSDIYQPILALQMPGLFSDWATLDSVRNQMMPEFKSGCAQNGFVFAGAGDVGLARTMSKGRAIRTPDDLKSMKVYRWQDDIIAPVTASVVGFPTVPSSVPGLLPALSSGRINVITVPALAATQLQWSGHLDHINASVAGVGVGGLIFTQKAAGESGRLPADLRAVLVNTGDKAGQMLTKRIRGEDAKAYEYLKGRMTLVELNASEKAAWETKFKAVRTRLGQGTFDAALVSKLESLAGR